MGARWKPENKKPRGGDGAKSSRATDHLQAAARRDGERAASVRRIGWQFNTRAEGRPGADRKRGATLGCVGPKGLFPIEYPFINIPSALPNNAGRSFGRPR